MVTDSVGRPAAVITGAASGIGQATAMVLADRGHDLVLIDRDRGRLEQVADSLARSGAAVLLEAADVADTRRLQAAVTAAEDRFGRLDVLVTCAGHIELVPLPDLTPEVLERMLAVHLRGTIMAVQAAAAVMGRAGYGRIVCVSSAAAGKGVLHHSHYAAAKAGIIGFVKSACKELGSLGITINAVQPGAIDTPLLSAMGEAERKAMAANPVGRIGTALDIAHAIAFLAAPEAAFVTGASLLVTGGDYT